MEQKELTRPALGGFRRPIQSLQLLLWQSQHIKITTRVKIATRIIPLPYGTIPAKLMGGATVSR